ncbi:MAG: pilus assembly protein TadG-related protein [Acidimicrobiales bacterium]
MPERRHRQEGQAALLAMVALLLAATAIAGVAHLGRAAAQRAGVQAAADAAALAGASGGRDAAERLAGANGAELVAFVAEGPDVEVTVVRGPVRATARARWDPSPIP